MIEMHIFKQNTVQEETSKDVMKDIEQLRSEAINFKSKSLVLKGIKSLIPRWLFNY